MCGIKCGLFDVFQNFYFTLLCRLTEMEILYKKEKEEADQLLEQQRLVSSNKPLFCEFKELTLFFVIKDVLNQLVISAEWV